MIATGVLICFHEGINGCDGDGGDDADSNNSSSDDDADDEGGAMILTTTATTMKANTAIMATN